LPFDLNNPSSPNNEVKKTDKGTIIFNGCKYTKEFKIHVVSEARSLNNNSKTARDMNKKYGLKLKETSIREWRKEISPELDAGRNKKKQIRDKICKYPKMEEDLMKWFLEKRKNKHAVTLKDITRQAKLLNNDSDFTASAGWFSNFRRRHNISKRIPTHVIQKLLANTMDSVKNYLTEIRDYRTQVEELNKCLPKRYTLFCNFDETAIQLNMNKAGTYDLIGSKEVLVQGTSNSKKRLTFLLAVFDTGKFLPPLIILQSRNIVPQQLRNKYKNKALMFSSPSGWITDEILLKWIKAFWSNLQIPEHTQVVLVFDQSPVHKKRT